MNNLKKKLIPVRFIYYAFISVFFLTISVDNLYAQSAKKNKARLNVQYVKIMNKEIYFDIKASSRIKKKTVLLSDIEISVFNKFDEEKILIGKTVTNKKGESRFKLKSIDQITPDSTNTYHMFFTFKGNDSFKKAKRSVHFKVADIVIDIIKKDSVNFIKAVLTESKSKNLITDEALSVFVQRSFKSLGIGKEFNNTDENGSILVAVENGIPGIDGNLTFEVVLNESDDYGTVKAFATAPVGEIIVTESTFDERTMWSPRNKTPIFLLIIPNLLIIGIWGSIIYLIINLFKLSKF